MSDTFSRPPFRVRHLFASVHEWDVDAPPYPLPLVTLASRQAMKIAEFVGEHCRHVNQLIIQSEFASSQLTVIAETIGGWTSVFLQRVFAACWHLADRTFLDDNVASDGV